MESISIFDIIKVGIGPSSSHTMGPWNAAISFIKKCENIQEISNIKEIFVELFGSLAKTGIGHGSDIAVILGLSGEDYQTIDTNTIIPKIELIKENEKIQIGIEKKEIPFVISKNLIFNKFKTLDYHPNGMIFRAVFQDGSTIEQEYYSIGGGFVVSNEEKNETTHCIRTLYPCHNAKDILKNIHNLGLKSVSDLVYINEVSWRTKEEINAHALYIWKEIKECIYKGITKEGILPGGLNVSRRAHGINSKLLAHQNYHNSEEWYQSILSAEHSFVTINKWVSCFALAVNEENASFGRVITAPTNGASGVIPAVLMYSQLFTQFKGEENIIKFLLVAGEIGTLFKKNATISAAMGGCQAEIGVSAAMAAAGLTEIMGGSPEQVLMAAEIAMEHHLGLTCDPIAGLVQIPCIERNSMGAMKAITAANLAIDSNPKKAKVSLDEVISSMWDTAKNMNSKYKETSEGGLAISVIVPEC